MVSSSSLKKCRGSSLVEQWIEFRSLPQQCGMKKLGEFGEALTLIGAR